MHEIVVERTGGRALARRSHVGVVASGNLEVLCDPAPESRARVTVRTTVDGFDAIWRSVLERFLARHDVAADFEVNDFGATPAMVTLRLEQALEAAGA
ncbi:MAG: malonate decarboxylase acyl carrier protein [Vulcanimicrobiaceae bacterium]